MVRAWSRRSNIRSTFRICRIEVGRKRRFRLSVVIRKLHQLWSTRVGSLIHVYSMRRMEAARYSRELLTPTTQKIGRPGQSSWCNGDVTTTIAARTPQFVVTQCVSPVFPQYVACRKSGADKVKLVSAATRRDVTHITASSANQHVYSSA